MYVCRFTSLRPDHPFLTDLAREPSSRACWNQVWRRLARVSRNVERFSDPFVPLFRVRVVASRARVGDEVSRRQPPYTRDRETLFNVKLAINRLPSGSKHRCL